MAEIPSSLSIREVAERSGCSPSALRYYEAEGLITALPRSETAARHYAPRVLDTLFVVNALRGAGFGIADIRSFLDTRQSNDPLPVRLDKVKAALDALSTTLRQRRAALEQAEQIVGQWQAEVAGVEAQQEKSPTLNCTDSTR